MKISRHIHMIALLAAMIAGGSTGFAASTGELLQQGLYAEEVEGNPDAAIKIYSRIAQSTTATPNQIAQALYRMAVCSVKIDDEATARKLVAKLVAEHSGEKDIVEKAQALMENLSEFDPATLMPPGTLAYIELGCPGQQVETILGALKGTPFENPLTSVGGARPAYTNDWQKTPADFIGALLNPSMVAEFKKLRSSAIGITGFDKQNPSMIAVISSGKSDALRGILLAALAMVATPCEPIEGMQAASFRLPDNKTVEVVYDDRVIIAAQPPSQLQWCVKQYKSQINEPSLASANKSFARLSAAQRRKNAMTVWAGIGDIYAQLLKSVPVGKIPAEFFVANAFVDFANIESLTVADFIEPASVGTRVELQFKEGHRCLAFDLIRTPNISKAALESVPSQAVALATFSLSESSASQADAVRGPLRNITGLDIGREVFANIEQVVLFALPGDTNAAESDKPEFLSSRLGLALTSRDPQKTRQVLATVLGSANPTFPRQLNGGRSQFKVGEAKGENVICHLDQINGITLLSLNPAVMDAAANAIKSRDSVLTAGSLKDAIGKLSPNASKLVLLNAGGAARFIGPNLKSASFNEEQAAQFRAGINQLARALDRTTIELRTDERTDNLAVSSRVGGIPPLNELIGPAMQLSRLLEQARSDAVAVNLKRAVPAMIMPAGKAPVIDGNADEAWSAAPRYKLETEIKSFGSGERPSAIASPEDLSADFRMLWDDKNLYVLVDVMDDELVSDTDPEHPVRLPSGSEQIPWWYDDSIEIYLDADNAKTTEYGQRDAMFRFNWGAKPMMRVYNRNVEKQVEGVEYAMVKTEKGYRLEVSFPWTASNVKPSAGKTVGLDVHVNDDDNGGARDHKLAWHDSTDQAFQNPQRFGNGLLGGLVGWWKFDETDGTTAKDSAGSNHDGKLVGNAKWAAGKIGGAIKLDGRGSFVRVQDKEDFNMGKQVTIAGWVNIHSVPTDWMAIVTKGDNSWRLSTFERERRFHCSVGQWDSIAVNSTMTVNQDTWHHVAAVYDGQELRLYVDGKLDSKQPWTEPVGQNNSDVLIGENSANPNRSFDGLIDDVRVYNYALGESEIKMLAASDLARN